MTETVRCAACAVTLPTSRVQVYTELFGSAPTRCTRCSTTEAPVVLMNYGHKTGGHITVVPQNADGSNNSERVRQAIRAYQRAR